MHFKPAFLSAFALAASSVNAAAVTARQETPALPLCSRMHRELWEIQLFNEFGWLAAIPILRVINRTDGNGTTEIIEVDEEAKRGIFKSQNIWADGLTEDETRAFFLNQKGKTETTFSATEWLYEDVICDK
ncbi:hypothetical protein DFP72DRAFT_871143 [Ephemerocybe angulata]|uniref:Uncharacterized protein n=1 Tax=Ephemerocybe angulata TaxID=980116 RepID=A0A8H6IEP4_9AGAR|nr:hypothetical protein DFP72DRAFT_871143 [Tulosesus angulatus]